MPKTKAQLEKRKRDVEKRKKTEKAILEKAAVMPYDEIKPGANPPSAGFGATKEKP